MGALGIHSCLCVCLCVFVHREQYFSDWINGTFLCTQAQSTQNEAFQRRKESEAKKIAALEMRQFVHSVAWEPFCPQKRIKSDWASSLAVWNSSYPFVHRTLLAAVSGIDISLTASLSLSPTPPLSSLHPSFRRLSAPYVPRLPTILGFVSTWADMWGWKEDGDTGGKEEEEAMGNV